MFEFINVHQTLCSVVSDGFVMSAVLWIFIESADGNQLFDVMGTVGGAGSPWPERSEIGQDSWIARLGTEWEKGETGITGERQGEGREEYDQRMKKRDEDKVEKRKSATRRSFKQERKRVQFQANNNEQSSISSVIFSHGYLKVKICSQILFPFY